MRKVQPERGGKNSISRLLGRGCSFAEIDRVRAIIEVQDRIDDRRRWGGGAPRDDETDGSAAPALGAG